MKWNLAFASDSSLMIGLPETATGHVSDRVTALFEALSESAELRGRLLNFRPAYRSLLVEFDPVATDPSALKAELENRLEALAAASSDTARQLEIPVHYGGVDGPDLIEVASAAGLSPAEVIERHTRPVYKVAFLGFSPGFPYLLGLPEELHCARKATPRVRVPKGSVAIGGAQTGIYPESSPGGWQIIGRADCELFDPHRMSPALLMPGDRLRFVSV